MENELSKIDGSDKLDENIDGIIEVLKAINCRITKVEDKADKFNGNEQPHVEEGASGGTRPKSSPRTSASQDQFRLPAPLKATGTSNKSPFRKPPHNTRMEFNETRQTRPENQPPQVAQGENPVSSVPQRASSDFQGDFKSLKDSYQTVDIPSEYKLHADRAGVKREDQTRVNLVASCAKYSETLLRIIAADEDNIDLLKEKIYVTAIAQQKFLQAEYAAILVNSSFDSHTARFFKQLQKNTSSFSPEALANLQAAATIASAHNPSSSSESGS